jgi:hypothetical protein
MFEFVARLEIMAGEGFKDEWFKHSSKYGTILLWNGQFQIE